jgi:hypothetical protein
VKMVMHLISPKRRGISSLPERLPVSQQGFLYSVIRRRMTIRYVYKLSVSTHEDPSSRLQVP